MSYNSSFFVLQDICHHYWMRCPLMNFGDGHIQALGFLVGSNRAAAFMGHLENLCLPSRPSSCLNGKLVNWLACASPY
jgi:hypothetical protein